MKNFIKNNWMSLVFIGTAVCFGYWISPHLHDKIPSHYNFKGEPDAFEGKPFSLLFLPALNLIILILIPFLIRLSPAPYQMQHSSKSLYRMNFTLTFLLMGIYVVTLQKSARSVVFLLPLNLGVIFSLSMVLIGNYLAKIERNFFVGIRTPWAIASERNWEATHLFASRVFVGLGIVSTVCSFFSEKLYAALSLLAAAALLSVGYSFYYYVKKDRRNA